MKHPMGSRLFGPAMLLIAVGLLLLGGVIQAGNGKGKGNGKDDAGDDQDGPSFRVSLSGGAESPAILTTGEGVLNLKVDGSTIAYDLEYNTLKNNAPAVVAHIHVGQRGASGAVAAFLCGGGGKPACPVPGTKLSGTIAASDILAIPAQGLAAGDMTAFLAAMRRGLLYANLHSALFPGGEIRGQITHGRSND
jgi:CHRD domain-containing protein